MKIEGKTKKYTLIIATIFLSAFLLNVAWEFAHHVLYENYKGGEITNLILLRAALFDAVFIAILFSPFVLWSNFKKTWWMPAIIALVFAVGLEQFALQTNRWAYLPNMPLIPFLGSGLTPTLQLAITGLLSARIGTINVRKIQ